jgi:hypothetical protein
MSKRPRDREAEARKAVAHRAYMEALRSGQRPPRASTFKDRRKEASRRECRSFKYTG